MKNEAVFIFSNQLMDYKFGANHPFDQKRIQITMDLLDKANALKKEHIIPPRMATDEELELIHDPDFINAVKLAGKGKLTGSEALKYGLGTEDTPIFEKMHEASALVVGGALEAADYVMTGKAEHALHLAGGLHHSMKDRASGFCVYNDCSVAIRYIREKYQAKVLYIDTDAHHGDGVQWCFYDDPMVCTVSIHETGRYLFPGTGNVFERGHGRGYGFSFNFPLDAYTEDESWLYAYRRAIMKIADYFKPDVLFTQNGADAHYYDPLTHLSTTMEIYRVIPKLAHQIAHQYCKGRWIAVGGGGYDIWRVVPRAWSLLWLEMTGQVRKGSLPQEWIETWQPQSPVQLPKEWDDPLDLYPPIPRKKEIEEKNRRTVHQVLQWLESRK